MHLLLLLAIVLVVLVVLSVTVCLCYGLNSASCMTAFKLNSAAHSVAGLYNGYADPSSPSDGACNGSSSSAVVAPLERRNYGPPEQISSYSSVIELYDSTWQVKEPPPPRHCRLASAACRATLDGPPDAKQPQRWYVGDVREGDVVHGQVTLEKIDLGCSSASLLFPDACDKNGALPCSRFAGVAAVSLPSVLKGASWNRRESCSPLTDIDGAERFRLEVRSCSLLEEGPGGGQVSPVGS